MSGRIVLVTGATGGIGREIVHRLAARGDRPLLVGRNEATLQTLVQEVPGGEAMVCDVTKRNQVERLVEDVISRYGRLDVLINNAGYGRFGGALEVPIEEYAGMMEANYLGAVHMSLAFLPHMLQSGAGRIVNIASIAGLTGAPNLAGYCASKFALLGFSESLQMEFAPRIQVSVLCPGPVDTPFFRGVSPFRYFPSPIARRTLPPSVVAEHTLRLIDRPGIKVIPRSLGMAIRLRRWFPRMAVRLTGHLYHTLRKQKSVSAVSSSPGRSES
ncbi:SDR family NAD(P)-dependent oxidoreductase [Polycladomyces subterraneus]|uniref:SDR family NAD(P)-dependent oxidoreductase n=1 Tax=Polycladomyces subterraneus TaxID=1016997 RepID=A0ABT8IQA2_9BACL|nr:SDR family NAD(P)-dependent oxidoreductase [Polycladomyces subterraneus]MDN4594691.1 SDR family NAD(P)-dependent oxidoreductase [Polycladomyces subterraneus]